MNDETIGARVRRLREQARLTTRDLGIQVGCSASTISRLENDLDPGGMNVRVLIAIAGLFGVSLDYLCRGEASRLRYTARAYRMGWNDAVHSMGQRVLNLALGPVDLPLPAFPS